MQYQFTPAAQRALAAAAGWTSRPDSDELEAPALLLGLLAEPECRAAIMLAGHGVHAAAVRDRWPELTPRNPPLENATAPSLRFSAEVELSLQMACERLAEYPRPLELATEHLLLGLVAAQHEASAWLRQHGLDQQKLEAEIHQLYGHQPGPLPLEPEGPLPLEREDASQSPLFLRERAGVRGVQEGEKNGEKNTEDQTQPDSPQYPHPNPLPQGEGIHVLRVLDAAANRAREGLRAVEDYVRFVLDDRHLTGLCKQLRHDLAAALGRISTRHRLAARETRADVGTVLAVPSEQSRDDAAGVLTANLVRFQEGLRSLEEFGKLLDHDVAAEVKQLRYRSYTLQRAVEITRSSLERLDQVRLYVLIDGRPSVEEFRRLVGSLVEAGVHMLQLRDKGLDDRKLLERARLLRELTRQSDTLFIINDRPDLAVLAWADGVHVGQEELTVKDARTIVGPEALIGVSTHTIEQARQAVLDGVNYIGVGPVFPSGTKHFDQFPGVELLRAVASEIRLPAFAIGGITGENLSEVFSAGFTRIAVSGAITASDDPAAVVREMLAMLAR